MISQRARESNSVELGFLQNGFNKCLFSPYHPADNPGGIINLGTSENLICDDLVIPKLESLTNITPPEVRYFPVNGMIELRREVGRFLGEKTRADVKITEADLTVMNGCSSVFCFAAYVIGNEGDHYLIPSPYYGMTANYMKGYNGLQPIGVDVDENNMVSVQMLKSKYEESVSEGKTVCGIVLINPHNPTGAVYDKDLVMDILNFACSRDIHVVIDEIYFLSVFEEGAFQSCLSYSQEWPDPDRTHFMWSFSKDFAMSGSRCAVLYSKNRNVHSSYERVGFYHMVAGIIQMKLCAMLRDTDWVDGYLTESRLRLKEHADMVMQSLDAIGISYFKPVGTLYLWADFTTVFKNIPSESEADAIFFGMLDNLIYIPSAKGFNGSNPKYFRIVFAIPKDYLIEAMKRLEDFVLSYRSLV